MEAKAEMHGMILGHCDATYLPNYYLRFCLNEICRNSKKDTLERQRLCAEFLKSPTKFCEGVMESRQGKAFEPESLAWADKICVKSNDVFVPATTADLEKYMATNGEIFEDTKHGSQLLEKADDALKQDASTDQSSFASQTESIPFARAELLQPSDAVFSTVRDQLLFVGEAVDSTRWNDFQKVIVAFIASFVPTVRRQAGVSCDEHNALLGSHASLSVLLQMDPKDRDKLLQFWDVTKAERGVDLGNGFRLTGIYGVFLCHDRSIPLSWVKDKPELDWTDDDALFLVCSPIDLTLSNSNKRGTSSSVATSSIQLAYFHGLLGSAKTVVEKSNSARANGEADVERPDFYVFKSFLDDPFTLFFPKANDVLFKHLQGRFSAPIGDIVKYYSKSVGTEFSSVKISSEVVPANGNIPLAPSSSPGRWEMAVAARIAREVAETMGEHPGRPFMVALTGFPGSGIFASSLLLQSLLENRHGLFSSVFPHDGYHFPIDYLKTHFPDSEDAIYRRGAPDTFDPAGLYRDLMRIRHNTEDENLVKLPGFDHSKGDPEPDVHFFDRERHQVVICEGLYLLHEHDGWEDIAGMFDLKIFMEQDLEICLERVKIRNRVIPGYSPEEIDARTEVVDRRNAEIVEQSKHRADLVVQGNQRMRPSPSMTEAEFENITSTFLGPFIPIEHHEQHSNATAVDTDWQMDITSRMRGESFSLMDDQYVPPSRPRTPSVYSEPEEPPPPAAQFLGTWEPAMAERIKLRYQKIKKEKRPFMVALVGLPGGGKSVSSFLLASMLDEKKLSTFVTPHDGYHYPLEYLRTQRNADDLIYRRGAPDTFDPAALYRDLLRLRNGDEQIIKLPAFNHARADPEPDTHIFNRRQHKIVLCEGLYLLHNDDGWNEIANVFDLTIFLDTPLEVCLERVKIRNQCIPGYTPEEIAVRTEIVDRANALKVRASRSRSDYIVHAEDSSSKLTVVIEKNPAKARGPSP